MKTKKRMPFEGIKVLDLGIAGAPLAGLLLADMGADVIKVEPPGGLLYQRQVNVLARGGEAESTLVISFERNKKSLTLNWHKDAGRKILLKLAERCDVFIENFGPGHVEKWGIDYETVRRTNPRVIYCSMTAFGSSGPLSHKRAVDLVLQGYAGHMAITGPLGGPPVKCGPPIGDFSGIWLAAFGIVTALHARERWGIGQKVDSALLDGAVFALMPREQEYWMAGRSQERLGTRHVSCVPHQAFETKDDRYLDVCVLTEDEWLRFCNAIGKPELINDKRFVTLWERYENRETLIPMLASMFRQNTLGEWLRKLEAADIICGPILTTAEALSNPQLIHNNMVLELEHPRAGKVKALGIPVKLSETPGAVYAPSPTVGQHTDEILRDLGIKPDEISRLREEKVI